MDLLPRMSPLLLILLLQCLCVASNTIEQCGSYTDWGKKCTHWGSEDDPYCGSVLRIRSCTNNNNLCWQEYESVPCYKNDTVTFFGMTWNRTTCDKAKNAELIAARKVKGMNTFRRNCSSCSNCHVPLYETAKFSSITYVSPAALGSEVIIRGTVCQPMTDWGSECLDKVKGKIAEAHKLCGSVARYEYCQNATDCWRNYQLQPCYAKLKFFGILLKQEGCVRKESAIEQNFLPISNVTKFCTSCFRQDKCDHQA